MAVDVETLLAPPDGSGELEVHWFDWLPRPGTGETQKDAVIAKLDGYKAAAEVLLAAAEVEVADAAVTAYIYWQAFKSLCIEYGRRVGSTTIHNEVTQATGTATAKPFCDAAAEWKAKWVVFVPEASVGSGSGVSASVPSHFRF